MDALGEALAAAVADQQAGRAAEAERMYRLILQVQPDHAAALNNLALLAPQSEAVDLLEKAIASEPDYVDALINLSSALAASGRPDEADAPYQRALGLIPADPDTLYKLAVMLHSQGRSEDALLQLERILTIVPKSTAVLCEAGLVQSALGRDDLAAGYYRRALEISPDLPAANLNLAGLLENEGRLAEAQRHRERLPHPQALIMEPGPATARTVLVLAHSCSGNIPVDTLIPLDRNNRVRWWVEFATDAQEAALPHYDVIFNAVGNPDLMAPSADRITRLHQRQPVLNSPASVAATRRDLMPWLLGDIAQVVVPPTIRLPREALLTSDLAATLAAEGLACPLLIRPAVTHGGDGVVLARAPDDLQNLTLDASDAFYITAYHDYRSDDGFYRKYRMIFVDRAIYAYHLAISPSWLVHYYSADMLHAPWKREEEERFLNDPIAVLGAKSMDALRAIAVRLDLDYAGIDFSVLPDGRLLVFEANATMLVHLHDPIEDFPYKHIHVPTIFQAFDAMLDRHRIPAAALVDQSGTE